MLKNRVRLAFYLMLPLLMAGNWFVFRSLGYDYFSWYLANGSKIAAATLLGVLSWSALAGTYDLLSRNPADYSRACLFVAGTVVRDLGIEIVAPRSKLSEDSLWDKAATLVVLPVLLAVVIMWVVVVSPLNYLVTLLGGAPARLFRRDRVPNAGEPPQTARLGDKPLELTQAINTLLLLIVAKVLG